MLCGECVNKNETEQGTTVHLVENDSQGSKHVTGSFGAIDGLRTLCALAKVVVNVAQASLPMLQVSAPVVFGDEECGGGTSPVEHFQKLV